MGMGLIGTWYNELGSILVISNVRRGVLSGSYETAVSSSGCAQGTFNVVGVTDTDSGGHNVGFAISWNNQNSQCASVTAWSGQLLSDANGNPYITAFWLLTVESTQANSWSATHVGQDTFTTQQPTADEVTQKSQAIRRSHP
jgi:hypothetical protein